MSEPSQILPDGVTVLEGMTSISALLNAREEGVNDRPIHEILFAEEKAKSKADDLRFLKNKAKNMNFKVEIVPESDFSAFVTGSTHGGIIAFCGDRTIPALTDPAQLPKNGFYVLTEGIEDPFNFGYSIRSLYAAGADGMLLTPRNWMSAAGTVARSSAGTSERMNFFTCDSADAVRICHEAGYRVVCAGIRDSVPMEEADLSRPLLLVIGGEKRGISRAVLDASDQTVRIEYGRAFRGSLSTAATVAILGFEVLRQQKRK